MGKVAAAALLAALIFVSPSLWLRATTPLIAPSQATQADAALIFGAVVRSGRISPLHKERLDAGAALIRSGSVPVLVVSNTKDAAQTMEAYLIRSGIPPEAIRQDTQAERSPDTCAEAARRGHTQVIYVSQKFHLPRLRLHCARYGLDAQYVVADSLTRAAAPLWTKIRVRGTRFLREAALTWGTLLRVYPHQPVTRSKLSSSDI